VICNQHRLAKNRLPVSMRNYFVKINIGIENERFHRIEIVPEQRKTRLPCRQILRCRIFRPTTFGPFRRLVFGATDEFKNIPLRDTDVFKELPKRPKTAYRSFRKVFERELVEGNAYFDMSLTSI